MDSIVLVDGFHGMVDGFHTFFYFFQMDSMVFPDGFHGISRWIPNGLSSWNYDSTLNLHHFQGGVHMDSTWNKLLIT